MRVYRGQRERLIALALGSAEVAAQHDPAASVLQMFDGGQGLLQAGGIGYLPCALVLCHIAPHTFIHGSSVPRCAFLRRTDRHAARCERKAPGEH
jgi:hypothetical protein